MNDHFDADAALEQATEKEYADILVDIIGHPEGAPTIADLDTMNPSLSPETLRERLQTLQDARIVTINQDEETKYRLTDAALELFDENGLFPEAAWHRQYDSVEK